MVIRKSSFISKMIISSVMILGLQSSTNSQDNDSDKALSMVTAQECFTGKKSDGPWIYLEHHFVIIPTKKINAISTNALTLISATTSIACLIATMQPEQSYKFNPFQGLAIAGLTKVAYDAYCSRAEQMIKINTMKSFLDNWQTHREFTPIELVPAFDELEAYYLSHGKNLPDATVMEMFEIICHLIEHTFAKRYEKDKARSLDPLTCLKTITDVAKNLTGK